MLFAACGGSPQQEGDGAITSLEELQSADIGVLSGSNHPVLVQQALPQVNLLYYNSRADQLNALKSGKIQALSVDEPAGRNMQAEDDSITMLPELLDAQSYAFCFKKNGEKEALCAELSEYLRSLKEAGTMEELQEKWLDQANLTELEMTDYRDLPPVNGTVHLGIFQDPPFNLYNGDLELYVGYETELMTLFCQEYGYALEITDMNVDALLPAVQSGKCDVACGCISVTEERKESILFSEPDYVGGTALMVLKADAGEGSGNFFSSVKSSFEKTFLREGRWKLFLEGIGTTLLITVLSAIFGTLLGFLVFLLCRKGNPVANGITKACVWLIQGMPVVVLLMVFYYIIFGAVKIPGTVVSVVAFTLVFGASVFAIIKTGVGTVDKGQTEGAYALGYTDRQTFYKVIFPQALPHMMPAYKGEITSLVKATAVVGYVAVQDLTKMGDIVRSRTYEAFFPLIAVAVIYFILAALLIFIVKRIEIRIDPKRRTREQILKGTERHD